MVYQENLFFFVILFHNLKHKYVKLFKGVSYLPDIPPPPSAYATGNLIFYHELLSYKFIMEKIGYRNELITFGFSSNTAYAA